MTTTPSTAAAIVHTHPQSTRHIVSIAAAGPLLLAIGWLLVGHLPHSPLWIATTRVLPAGLLLTALRPKLPTGTWWHRSAILGATNFAGFFTLQAVALQTIPAGVAATIAATQTLLVPLSAVILLNTPLHRRHIIYAATGLLGVALLLLPNPTQLNLAGMAAALGTATCTTLGLLLTRRWGQPDGVHHLTTTGWQLLAGGLVLLPVAMLTESPLPPISGTALPITAAITTTTAVAFAALFGALHAGLSAATVSRLMLLCPLAVTATGWLLSHQNLTVLQLLGALLVVLPAAAADRPSPAPEPTPPPSLVVESNRSPANR
jgi:probable blue pigment (indigoidine) exporter